MCSSIRLLKHRVGAIAAFVAVAILAACSTLGLTGNTTTTATSAQTVYAMASDYAVSLSIPAVYEALPRCQGAATAQVACSNPTVVDGIRKAVTTADAAIDNAETAVISGGGNAQAAIGAAQGAMTEIYTIMAQLKVPTTASGAGPTGAMDAATVSMIMQGVSAILVALPAVTQTFIDAKNAKAQTDALLAAKADPTADQWAAVDAARRARSLAIRTD